MDGDTSFGQSLKQRRKELDLTQADLARQVGCAVITLQKIEAGTRRPSNQIARRMAHALALEADELTAFVRLARAALHHSPTNIPTPLTPLIGRAADVAAVDELLLRPSMRLLTLVGPPGIGKTRLAIHAVTELLDDTSPLPPQRERGLRGAGQFRDGITFVALAPISAPALVAAAIARTLGVKESAGQTVVEGLKYALRPRHTLLLLDNFEQVVAAAPLIAELLAAAPGLKVLVTSRTPLHITGEHQYAVPPLALPNPNAVQDIATLMHTAAVDLFVQRAQAVQADFVLSDTNARDIAEICARLDGLPLAIELAAARIKLFTPHTLLARLDQRFAVLTDGPCDLPARQQTLRNAVAWSYELLTEGEQALFRRLGVFVGGWTIEAAETVCGGSDAADPTPISQLPTPILDGLAALLDQSLLRQKSDSASEARFTMLETIREYAIEQLETSGEADALRQRHTDYFLTLVEAAEPEFYGPDQWTWLARLEVEHDNLRAALTWSHAAPDGAEREVRLVGALGDFWFDRGALNEARVWIEQALARHHSVSPLAQAMLFRAAAGLAFHENDNPRAIAFEEQALLLWRQFGDRLQIADSLDRLGRVTRIFGDLDRSRVAVEEALQLFREVGVPSRIAGALLAQGDIAFDLGDYTLATTLFQEGLALARQHADPDYAAVALLTLARVARAEGDYAQAVALYEESLDGYPSKHGFSTFILFELGKATIDQGDYARATALFRVLMVEHKEVRWTLPAGLESIAAIAAAQGANERAAQLWGAAEALRESTGLPMNTLEIQDYERWVSAARARIDSVTFATAWAAGRAMSLNQAIAEAQAPIRKHTISDILDDNVLKQIPDALWQRIAPLLPPAPHHHTGRPRLPDRQAMTAIFYALETGCGWKALPRTLGAPSTIHDRFREWRTAGVFERLWRTGLLPEAIAHRLVLREQAQEL
jgi:predicted ATPase/DNA-binding XRE family transcriptional regulator